MRGCISQVNTAKRVCVLLTGRDDEGIQSMRQHVFDFLLFQLWIFFRRRDHEKISSLAHCHAKDP